MRTHPSDRHHLGCSRCSRRVRGCNWQDRGSFRRHEAAKSQPPACPSLLVDALHTWQSLRREVTRSLGDTAPQGPVCGEPLHAARARPMAAQGGLWNAQCVDQAHGSVLDAVLACRWSSAWIITGRMKLQCTGNRSLQGAGKSDSHTTSMLRCISHGPVRRSCHANCGVVGWRRDEVAISSGT